MWILTTRSLAQSAAPTLKAASITPRAAAIGARSITNLAKKAYTAQGQAGGKGRDGKAILTAEGPFEVKLA